MPRKFSKLFGSARKPRPTRQFRLEALEDRACPAVTTSLSGTTLTITGDGLPDEVRVVVNDATNQVRVESFGQAPRTFASSQVARINADLKAGDNRFTFETPSSLTRPKNVSLKTGWGNDTLDATLWGHIEGVALNITADLGDGADKADVKVLGVVRGSANATFRVDGSGGNDTLRFYNDNGSHAGAQLKADYNGGDGNDVIAMVYDDIVTGQYELGAKGGRGDDTLTANVHTRAGSAGTMYAHMNGEDGNDTLSLKMDDVAGTVRTALAGGAGNDAVSADYGRPFGAGNLESAKLNVHLDLGVGNDTADVKVLGVMRGATDARFELYGRHGDDTISYYNDNGSHAGAKCHVLMQGNEGKDTLTAFFDDIATGQYGYYLDGGDGDDTIRAEMHSRPAAALGTMKVDLVGGAGHDRLSYQADQVCTALSLGLHGGAGNDAATADFGRPFGAGNIEGARVGVFMDLGDGHDAGAVNGLGVLRGSTDFNVRMQGGNGDDSLRFTNDNGSHAGAKLSVALDGGAGNDHLWALFDDNIIGTYQFHLAGGGGNDRVEAVMHARSGSTGSLAIEAKGDAGRDAVRLEVHDQSAGRLRLTRAVADGGADLDALLSATSNVRRVSFP